MINGTCFSQVAIEGLNKATVQSGDFPCLMAPAGPWELVFFFGVGAYFFGVFLVFFGGCFWCFFLFFRALARKILGFFFRGAVSKTGNSRSATVRTSRGKNG